MEHEKASWGGREMHEKAGWDMAKMHEKAIWTFDQASCFRKMIIAPLKN